MSRSLHELRAAARPGPDNSGSSSSPNPRGYFGWEVIRRMQAPPTFSTISDTDVTPERTLRAMQGLSAFPEIPIVDEAPQVPISKHPRIPNPPPSEHGGFKSGRREAANRRRMMANNTDRGGRSPQNHGKRGH